MNLTGSVYKGDAMKAMLYMPGKTEPVAVFDHVDVVRMNDNHTPRRERIFSAPAN